LKALHLFGSSTYVSVLTTERIAFSVSGIFSECDGVVYLFLIWGREHAGGGTHLGLG
jgi:hypothetical protein